VLRFSIWSLPEHGGIRCRNSAKDRNRYLLKRLMRCAAIAVSRVPCSFWRLAISALAQEQGPAKRQDPELASTIRLACRGASIGSIRRRGWAAARSPRPGPPLRFGNRDRGQVTPPSAIPRTTGAQALGGEQMQDSNDEVLSRQARTSVLRPILVLIRAGVPAQLLTPALPFYFIQTPKQVMDDLGDPIIRCAAST